MRTVLGWVGVGLVVLACAACAGPARTVPGEERLAERFEIYVGSILEFANSGGEPILVLWSEGKGTRVYRVGDRTTLSRDGRAATLADLRVGDRVEVWTVHGSDLATEVIGRSR